MSKSILILETPDRCFDCPCYKQYVQTDECGILEKELLNDNLWNGRPDWCPMFSIPERSQDKRQWDEYEDGWDDGWNSCISYLENAGKSRVLESENDNETGVS